MTTAPTACVLNKESCWRSNPISPGLLFWVFYTLEEPSSQHLFHAIKLKVQIDTSQWSPEDIDLLCISICEVSVLLNIFY